MILAMLLSVISSCAQAQSDLQIYTLARSYPASATLNINAGYGLKVWGNENRGGAPIYGFLRPFVEGSTAGSYNSGIVGIELFPIAFLGATFGEEWIANGADYRAYDCVTNKCKGRYRRTFAQAQVALAAGNLFFVGRGKIEDWYDRESTGVDFIEPTAGLVARSKGDRLRSLTTIVGWNYSPTLRISALSQYAEMMQIRGIMHAHYLAVSLIMGSWNLIGAGGGFASTIKSWEPSALFKLSWTPRASLDIM